MEHFTVEETNLICIYISDTRAELIEEITGALPFMDEEMRILADHTLDKLRAMTDAEFEVQSFDFTDEEK
ncbi:MAG: transposon-transfer assisting family protein [Candidatus Pelethousia sp.]|nr:transposon-transfer assisting family protein [Candidatus Pelethousia sp.]